MLRKDQFYKDILDGLSLFYESDFITDIRNTALQFPVSALGNALNRRQTACKLWLLDALHDCHGGDLGVVHILGGWYGVLAALIRHDPRFRCERLISIDIDPDCETVARALNASDTDNFLAVTGDAYQIDYHATEISVAAMNGSGPTIVPRPDILINTSCEHLDRFDNWYARLPEDILLVLQSNDYFAEPEHVNCVETLPDFQAQAPMSRLSYEGELPLDKYTRFMLIGRK